MLSISHLVAALLSLAQSPPKNEICHLLGLMLAGVRLLYMAAFSKLPEKNEIYRYIYILI